MGGWGYARNVESPTSSRKDARGPGGQAAWQEKGWEEGRGTRVSERASKRASKGVGGWQSTLLRQTSRLAR